MLPKSIPGGPGEHSGARNGPGSGEGVILMALWSKKESLLAGFWKTFSDVFSSSGLPDTKKSVCGRGPSKLDPFFIDFGVSPEGLRRVPVYTGARFSLLQPEPEKVPKWDPIWVRIGPPFPESCPQSDPKSSKIHPKCSQSPSREARGSTLEPEMVQEVEKE